MPTFIALIDSDSREIIRICLIVGFLIVSLSIHEWAHAFAAHKLGDDTAKDLGRMTPSPLVHIDPIMTIALPALLLFVSGGAFVFGGAKPVPVDPRNFKHPQAANAIVAAAGPLSNFLLMFVFLFAYDVSVVTGGYDTDELLPQVLFLSAWANVLLAVFNLIPLPPLDGSRIVMWLLPPAARLPYAALERFGIFIVIGLLYYGGLRPVISQTSSAILEWAHSLVFQFARLVGVS